MQIVFNTNGPDIRTLRSVSRLMALSVLVVAIFVSSIVNVSQWHGVLEGEGTGSVLVQEGHGQKAIAANLASSTKKSPEKKTAGGDVGCTGHCASHTMNLPALTSALIAPRVVATTWLAQLAVWVPTVSPLRLDRPPKL